MQRRPNLHYIHFQLLFATVPCIALQVGIFPRAGTAVPPRPCGVSWLAMNILTTLLKAGMILKYNWSDLDSAVP